MSSTHDKGNVLILFVGEWDLVSFYAQKEDKRTYPFGEDSVGRLLYTASGHMCAHLAKKEQTKPSSKNMLAYTDAEKSTAFGEALAYTGEYDIDATAQTVTHHVFTSTDPNQTGTDLTRDFDFGEGNKTLSLSLTYHDGSKMVLEWRRLEKYVLGTAAASGERKLG